MAYQSLFAETVNLRGHEGTLIDGYFARPGGAGPFPGVVMIHHMPGYDDGHKELARNLAHRGYAVILPNLHFREGKATPEANSESVRAAGGMPDDRTIGDVAAAVKFLRDLPYHNGKVGVIGFCSGGRQTFLSACTVPGIDAAAMCYGGGVVQKPEEITPRQPVSPLTFTKNLQCPLLGLFGKEDKRPSPQDAATLEAELKKCGKTYEFHHYDNTGHSFFHPERPSYRQHAAVDGWQRVYAWYDKYLR
jgi:carboxymethylenebutenolidase